MMNKVRSNASRNELSCEQRQVVDKWLAERRYSLALRCAARGGVQSRKTRTAYFRIKSDKTAYFRLLSPFADSRGGGGYSYGKGK